MRTLNVLYLILLSILFSVSLKAQETITIGTRHTVFSLILNEEREYWVYIPEQHKGETTTSYPVLYLLDGDSFFHSVVGYARFFSSSKASSFPPCIIVAVLNTDRTRDLTPTRSAARRDGTIRSGDKPVGGGAEFFFRFLTEELRPEIEKKASTNGQNFLVGHSYAGLFTLHILLSHPEAFDTYIALDPSLWWDGGYILKRVKHDSEIIDFSGKQLYVGFATQPRRDKKLIHFPLVDTFFETAIPRLEKQQLRLVCRKFPLEVHGTIALPGIYDGLKSLFPGDAISF